MLNETPAKLTQSVNHLAIIMDGNGRWAAARGMPRTYGHKAGVEALRRTVKSVPKFGIKHLTLYAFSSENWSRPADEIKDLLSLLKLYIRRDLAELAANGVRVRIIGRREGLRPDILALIESAEEKTAHNTELNLNIAFNYGGRDEIVRAMQTVIDDPSGPVAKGERVTEQHISAALDTVASPDPDLILRTSGEVRLSNFLLWQVAYAEMVFLDCLWPDFDEHHLAEAIEIFTRRDRRFGRVEAVKGAAQ